MKDTLNFLTQLACNNNREWFTANKEWYVACRNRFADFSQTYINAMAEIDPTLSGLTPADCIWRIYRDVRFSADKRPYKEWFGVFLAAKGGKKSMRGGYYVHIQPGHCMFAGGIWCPNPDLLKALKNEIFANYDEVEEIMNKPDFKRYFNDFDDEWTLKKVPTGFPADFVHADWLKRKAYTISCLISDEDVCSPDFLHKIVEIAKAAKPLNDFLNYTFEEYGEFPSRCGR